MPRQVPRLSQDTPYSVRQLACIIQAAGGLPVTPYQEYQPTDDNARLDHENDEFSMDSSLERSEQYKPKCRREALIEKLGAAIWWWDLNRWKSDKTEFTQAQLATRARGIENAAKKLLLELGIDHTDSTDAMPDQLIWALAGQLKPEADKFARAMRWNFAQPKLMLENAARQVTYLREWGRRAAIEAESHGKIERSERNQGDVALNQFIQSLAGIYFEIFEKQPKTSRADNAPSGKFLAFVKACLEPLLDGDPMPTDFALENRIRKAIEPYKTIERREKAKIVKPTSKKI